LQISDLRANAKGLVPTIRESRTTHRDVAGDCGAVMDR
jgi:hypothetical protein